MPDSKRFLEEDELADEQKRLVQKLVTRMKRFMEDGGARFPPEESYGIFGIFGNRGSGKTTVGRVVLDRLRQDSESLIIDQPLDCSTFHGDLPLGLNILQHIQAQARVSLSLGSEDDFEVDRKWREVETLYLGLDAAYRKLKLSLAITSSEYEKMARNEATIRIQIRRAVQAWIGELLKLLPAAAQDDRKFLIVSLDDLDLPLPALMFDPFGTFLYELDDRRLLFLVMADEERLERVISSSRSSGHQHFPASTVSQLLSKMIPESHRVYLEPWPEAKRLGFSIVEGGRTLGNVIKEVLSRIDTAPVSLATLKLLLPTFPRGLSDLCRNLDHGRESGVEGASSDHKDLVLTIARCRGDHRVARILAERSLGWWGGHWSWRAEGGDDLESAWEQLVAEASTGDMAIGALAALTLPLNLEKEDQAIWAEFLLNIYMQEKPDRAVQFVSRFGPLRSRLHLCSFEIELSTVQATTIFRSEEWLVKSPLLFWEGTRTSGVRARLGWGGLVENVLYPHRSKLADLLDEFSSPFSIHRERPGEILPAEIRPLVLLVDGMSRYPWGVLRERLEESLSKTEKGEVGRAWILEVLKVCQAIYLACCQYIADGDESLRLPFDEAGFLLEVENLDKYSETVKKEHFPVFDATRAFLDLCSRLSES